MPYSPSYSRQRTCGRECGAVLNTKSRMLLSVVKSKRMYTCQCGNTRTSGDGQRKWTMYCCAQCCIDAAGMRVNDIYATSLSLGIKGTGWLRLLMRWLAERDGIDCRICYLPVIMSLPSGPKGDPSGQGPSIDHITPRSKGGSDDPDNLRLTHWRCNYERRADPDSDWDVATRARDQ